jgi:hypothetical protein
MVYIVLATPNKKKSRPYPGSTRAQSVQYNEQVPTAVDRAKGNVLRFFGLAYGYHLRPVGKGTSLGWHQPHNPSGGFIRGGW